MKKRSLQIIAFSFLGLLVNAQSVYNQPFYTEPCATTIIHQYRMANDSNYKEQYKKNELLMNNTIKKHSLKKNTNVVYTIPVVVHVIHLGEPVGVGTNIPYAQIYSAVHSLNDAFRKRPGTIYDGNGVDTEIEFCLAVRDPNGQPTSGVNRVDGSVIASYTTDGIAVNGGNESQVKALSTWPGNEYLNIWVVSEIGNNNALYGVQGYAYLGCSSCGVAILYNAFGTTGNVKSYMRNNITTIHEVGHAFDLLHPFDNTASCSSETNCNTQGDYCCDTPPHPGGTTNNCAGPVCSGTQQVQNYMEYTYFFCQNMFTQNQKDRMAANITAVNPGLVSSNGCSSVSVPQSDFSSGSTTACIGDPIQFYDFSLFGGVNSWNWVFTGGTPSSSVVQNPIVAYNAPGTYNVSLTASNTIGTGNTETKNAYITVYSPLVPAACIPTSASLVNTDNGIYNVTFHTINNSTQSAYMDGGYMDFSCSEITTLIPGNSYPISVTLNISGNYQNLKVYVDYDNDGILNDTNEVVLTASNATGLQSGIVNIPFSVITDTLVRMRVLANGLSIFNSCTNPNWSQAEDYGIYFDSITFVGINSNNNTDYINLYPNPTNGIFSIQSTEKISTTEIINLLGEKIYTSHINSNKTDIDLSEESNGIYFLKIITESGIARKKIIISR